MATSHRQVTSVRQVWDAASPQQQAAIRDYVVRSLVNRGYPNPALFPVTKHTLRRAHEKRPLRVENPERDRLFDEAAA